MRRHRAHKSPAAYLYAEVACEEQRRMGQFMPARVREAETARGEAEGDARADGVYTHTPRWAHAPTTKYHAVYAREDLRQTILFTIPTYERMMPTTFCDTFSSR